MKNKDRTEYSPKFSLKRRVAFFPSVKELSGNPYWPVLASELEKRGVFFEHDTPATFDLKWLLSNKNRIGVLHLHYVQGFYKSSTVLRKIVKLLLFYSYMLMARSLGYRTIFTLHNLEPTYKVQPAWLDYLGHWCAANLSEHVIVHCKEARELLARRYGRRSGVFLVDHPNFIHYYPNTISKENARRQLDLLINSIVFLYFGGIRPNKGIDLLIQAFLRQKEESFRLVIAGNIFPPENYARSLEEIAVGDNRIDFHFRFIPNDEIQIFMNAADIVVLPFAKILTSSTAHLAMSFSRPVISPRMGCLPELLEPDAGWLFDPHAPDSLKAMMQAAANSDYHQFGLNAYNKVSCYTPERFADQTIKAYWG